MTDVIKYFCKKSIFIYLAFVYQLSETSKSSNHLPVCVLFSYTPYNCLVLILLISKTDCVHFNSFVIALILLVRSVLWHFRRNCRKCCNSLHVDWHVVWFVYDCSGYSCGIFNMPSAVDGIRFCVAECMWMLWTLQFSWDWSFMCEQTILWHWLCTVACKTSSPKLPVVSVGRCTCSFNSVFTLHWPGDGLCTTCILCHGCPLTSIWHLKLWWLSGG